MSEDSLPANRALNLYRCLKKILDLLLLIGVIIALVTLSVLFAGGRKKAYALEEDEARDFKKMQKAFNQGD